MSLLWVSLCLAMFSLHQAQAMDVPAYADFEPAKFSGQWYGVAVASNCPEFLPMKPILTMTNVQVTAHDNGDLDLAIAFPVGDKCMKRPMHFTMVSGGTYTETGAAKSLIKFAEVDYAISALEYSEQDSGNGDLCHTIKLYARERAIPEKCMQHFKMLMSLVNLTEDNLAELPKAEDCDPTSS